MMEDETDKITKKHSDGRHYYNNYFRYMLYT